MGVFSQTVPNILLSIDPEWADAILAGEKLWEYRKTAPARGPPMRLVLYATAPVQAAVGVAWSHTFREDTVPEVVAETVDQTPHEREDVLDYFGDVETGTAIRIDSYARIDDPVSRQTLESAGIGPTQNFRYINTVNLSEQSTDSPLVKPDEGPLSQSDDIATTPTESPEPCPQCRSEKVTSKGLLAGNECGYCGNEWADISAEQVERAVSTADVCELPDEFTEPLSVEDVDGRELRLTGQRGGEYRLTIRSDATGLLARRKSGCERNQFGSRWTNSHHVEYQFQSGSDNR